MTIFLGIDTGGTYTDAVLLDEASGVIAKAKALTTRDDLALGIAEAVERVLSDSGVPPQDIALASLSTTLATNALVEGQGGRACLVFIGFTEADLDHAGLRAALGTDPLVVLPGGHDSFGTAAAPLDLTPLKARMAELADSVTGFAITGQFAIRNPEHELAVRDFIRAHSDLPVTCGHELSAKLNGPRRALTCLLNARLISLLRRLTQATQSYLHRRGIDAPLMVVRGDGALISVELANARPVETILSGPAASLVGATYLTGEPEALVSDIGGTTTDIAVLRDGRPRIDEEGATVGGWRTMVEAVAMHTFGLGGDSEVALNDDPDGPPLRLGPRRAVPLSVLAMEHPELVHATLARQLIADIPGPRDGRFVVPLCAGPAALAGLTPAERALYDQAAAGPVAADRLAQGNYRDGVLNRLVAKGLVMIAALTPSDAAHVVGHHDAWDARAAAEGATLFARARDRLGCALAPDAATLSQRIIAALVRRSAEVLLDSAFAADGYRGRELSRHILTASALERRSGLVRFDLGLGVPLIGLGASAATYYPAVAAMLGARPIVPEHADVANAVGAVVGQVRVSAHLSVSQPQEGRFRVHMAEAPGDFASLDQAIAFAEQTVVGWARARALEAGAATAEVRVARRDNTATVEGKEIFLEAHLTATASGRPRVG